MTKAVLKKKNKAEGVILPAIRHCKTTGIKTAWYWHKNKYMDQWNKIEGPEINPHTYQSVGLQQRRQEYTMEGKVSLVSGVGKTDS